MPAVIQSTLYDSPGGSIVSGSTQQNSRDDLRLGYQVVLRSVHVATTYSWSLSFASDSPGSAGFGTPFDGTESSSALLPPDGSTSRDAKFNVDFEGSYLIRLVVDAGLPSEDTQFIRCRALTLFGGLKLVAAGERRDELGVIPVDASPEGWTNDQNANLQRIALLLRRLSTTGRVLYVDANRGRDAAADPDDYDNVISLPGTESARLEETGLKVRAMAHGDFSSINDAIAYAAAAASRGEPVPSATNPYWIRIQPGYYEEDLNLASFVHLIGDTGALDTKATGIFLSGPAVKPVVVRTANTGGTGGHVFNPQLASAEVILKGLHLEGVASTTAPVLSQTSGLLAMIQCVVLQQGDSPTQGPAVQVLTANGAYAPMLYAQESQVVTEATTATRSALLLDAPNSVVVLDKTSVQAASCVAVTANSTLYTNAVLRIRNQSFIYGSPAFQGYPSDLGVFQSTMYGYSGDGITISPPGGVGSKSGAVVVKVGHSTVQGPIRFKTSNAVGSTSLTVDSVAHTVSGGGQAILFPDAPGDLPDDFNTDLRAESIRYVQGYVDPRTGLAGTSTVPVANQVPEEDVQRVLDLLWRGVFPVTGAPFQDLNSSYNGLVTLSPFTPGVGQGRNINAVGGAVQIQGAVYPTGLESHQKDGGLQVQGVVDIGGFINGVPGQSLATVGGSEIHLNPNQAGSGPFVGLGRATWPNGITQPNRGFPAGFVVAGGAQTQAGALAYHLQLRTANQRTANTGKAGNVYVGAGSINDAASVSGSGDVHVMGGSTQNPAGTGGNLWLVPGTNPTPSVGAVWVTGRTTGGTPATLTPVNVYGVPVAGSILFATPVGIDTITFAGGENIAAAILLVAAQAKYLRAANVGGKLVLQGEYGPSGDILYLGDTVSGALNTALGNYILGSGAVFTPGTYGHSVSMDVPQNGRLRINGDLEYTGSLVPSPGGSGLGTYIQVPNGMSPYNTVLGTNVIGCDTTLGNVQIDITTGYPDATVLLVKHEVGTGAVSLVPQGGETINGQASYLLADNSTFPASGSAVALFKAGSDWQVWAEFFPPTTKVVDRTISHTWQSIERYDVALCALSAGVDITVTLDTNMPIGRVVVIKDVDGMADAIPSPGGQKIIVVDSGGALIDGAASLDITTAFASVNLVKTSSGNWAII